MAKAKKEMMRSATKRVKKKTGSKSGKRSPARVRRAEEPPCGCLDEVPTEIRSPGRDRAFAFGDRMLKALVRKSRPSRGGRMRGECRIANVE